MSEKDQRRGIPRARGTRLSIMAQIGQRINTVHKKGLAGPRRPSGRATDDIWARLQKLK